MKITFFTQNFQNYISGGRQYSWHVAHCLAMKGHKVLIVTDAMPLFDREYQDFPGRENIEILSNGFFFGTRDKKNLQRMMDADLLICTPVMSTDICVTFGKMYKKKIIGFLFEPLNMLQDALSSGIQIPMSETVENGHIDFTKQLHKVDMIVCNNRFTENKCKEWFPAYQGQIVHLYNSFLTNIADRIKIKSMKEREHAVVFLSRSVPYKGYGYIPYIFGQVKKKPKIYYISGFIDRMGPVENEFFNLCRNQAGLEIEVLRKIDEKQKFEILSRSKALFFLSEFEGFGLPPAESLYMKTPVVAFDLPVLKEVFGDLIHYVPFKNADYGINLFNKFFDNEKEFFRQTKESRERIKEFAGIENFANRLDSIVCSFMKGEKINLTESKEEKSQKEDLAEDSKKDDEFLNIKPEFESQVNKLFKKKDFQLTFVVMGDFNKQYWNEFELNFDLLFFNLCDDFNFEKIETEFVLICDSFIKLRKKTLDVIRALIREDVDIIYGGFYDSVNKKKVILPEMSFEMRAIYKDDCELNFLAIRKKSLKGLIRKNHNWFEQIFVNGQNMKWKNSGRILYDVKERTSEKKFLTIIPCRDETYIFNSVEFLSKIEHDVVICHHRPEGDFLPDILKLGKRPEVRKVLKFKGSFNFSRMNNVAFKKFSKDYNYVILMNDDIIPEKVCYEDLVNPFIDRWKKVGIVGAKLLYPNRKIQHGGIKLLKDRICTHIYRGKPEQWKPANIVKLVDAVTFAFVVIDVRCYQDIKLDKELPNSFNDVDFCLRAKEKGWKVVYDPSMVLIHEETVIRKKYGVVKDTSGQVLFKNRYKDLLKNQITYQDLRSLEENRQ